MGMSTLFQTIDLLSREKGIDPEVIVSAVEDAILAAARKYYKSQDDLLSVLNKDTGTVEVYAVKKAVKTVDDPTKEISLEEAREYNPDAVLEDEIRIPLPTDVLGRIAAQAAKQVIFQKVREAERESVHAEYTQRIGELVHCMVKRTEGPDVIVDLGRTEGRLPRREQSRLESYQVGDRVRAVIVDVDRAARGPQVIVSRADSLLVQRLFEMEVPEIYDGTVVIRTIAREAGERSKIAVFSRANDVDCVGACVGMKGSRVQSIIRELRGEKIDIIQYDEDPVQFANNAISPAKVNHVSVSDIEERRLEIVVDDTQLSLAIGRKGQNVRLAAKLLGWHVDIKSEEEKRQEVELQMAALTRSGTSIEVLEDIGKMTLKKLFQHDISTLEELAQTTPAELTAIPGIGEKTVEKIRQAVANFFENAPQEAAGEEESSEPEEGEAVAEASEELAAEAATVEGIEKSEDEPSLEASSEEAVREAEEKPAEVEAQAESAGEGTEATDLEAAGERAEEAVEAASASSAEAEAVEEASDSDPQPSETEESKSKPEE